MRATRSSLRRRPRDEGVTCPSIDAGTCPICRLPMWLVKSDLGDIAEQQHFECKVCDKTMVRTVAVNAPTLQPGT